MESRLTTKFKPYSGSDAFIFASYSHENSDIVFPILDRLHDMNYNIWYDEGIRPGEEWPEEIATHIDQCGAFLLFTTPASANSRNIRRETLMATNKNKFIINVYLSKTELSPGSEMQLNLNQAIKKYELDEETFFERLGNALKEHLKNVTPPPQPKPQPYPQPYPQPKPHPKPIELIIRITITVMSVVIVLGLLDKAFPNTLFGLENNIVNNVTIFPLTTISAPTQASIATLTPTPTPTDIPSPAPMPEAIPVNTDKVDKNMNLPVYSGPAESYIRGGNNNASVGTSGTIWVLGIENGWTLIEYKVNSPVAKWRRGYVHEIWDDRPIPDGFIKATTKSAVTLTDDPTMSQDELLTIPQNESVTVIGLDGKWAYIEYENARGYVRYTDLEL